MMHKAWSNKGEVPYHFFSRSSDNGLSPGRCQAIIWTNAGIFLIQPLGTNLVKFSYIFIQENALQNIVWKLQAILCWPQCVEYWTRYKKISWHFKQLDRSSSYCLQPFAGSGKILLLIYVGAECDGMYHVSKEMMGSLDLRDYLWIILDKSWKLRKSSLSTG